MMEHRVSIECEARLGCRVDTQATIMPVVHIPGNSLQLPNKIAPGIGALSE
jgi:hypothetical protein